MYIPNIYNIYIMKNDSPSVKIKCKNLIPYISLKIIINSILKN